jgi:hypothetical protein
MANPGASAKRWCQRTSARARNASASSRAASSTIVGQAQELGVAADLVEAEPAVELLSAVLCVRDEEDEVRPFGFRLLERAEDDRRGVAAVAVLGQRGNVLDLRRRLVGVEVGPTDCLAVDEDGEEARPEWYAPLGLEQLARELRGAPTAARA